jgi:hypothetical protein
LTDRNRAEPLPDHRVVIRNRFLNGNSVFDHPLKRSRVAVPGVTGRMLFGMVEGGGGRGAGLSDVRAQCVAGAAGVVPAMAGAVRAACRRGGTPAASSARAPAPFRPRRLVG